MYAERLTWKRTESKSAFASGAAWSGAPKRHAANPEEWRSEMQQPKTFIEGGALTEGPRRGVER